MSRSIHTTRRDLAQATRVRCAHRSAFAEARAQIRRDLQKKRRIKLRVAEERRAGPRPTGVPVDAIPIHVFDERPGVVHAASPEDIRAVLAALPPGVADGLSGIELRLGLEAQEEQARRKGGGERDPVTGRLGLDVLPGCAGGLVLGVYRPDGAIIEIYAHVRSPDAFFPEWAPLYLRLCALGTLVHEVGHHHDAVARVARGRWRADDTEKLEMYAEGREHAWLRDVVVPHLQRAHPEACASLDAWLLRHGGITFPLQELASDPRVTLRGNKRVYLFSIANAFLDLCRDVADGVSETCTQIAFARDLHHDDRYAEARRILAGVLAREPDHPDALVLGADIDVHEGENERAAATCRAVLARDPEHVDAWEVLADAERARRRWAEARDASTAALALRKPCDPWWYSALSFRARALLELGEHEALAADLEVLSQGKTRSKAVAAALGAISLVRRGLFEEALAAAKAGLVAGHTLFRAEIAAAGLDAAHRLGRPEEAPVMPPGWRVQLRWRGYEAWVESLPPVPASPPARGTRKRHATG